MSFLNPEIKFCAEKERKTIPETLLDFLRSLNGLTVFDIDGEDTSRCRVVTTLIHGNEPSGLIACHLWLKSLLVPATNLRIIICNPEAAKTKPFFTNRYVEHSEDLNRFFGNINIHTNQTVLSVRERANKITQLINDISPEAVVDLHNTSGVSPAFAVSVSENRKYLKLAELFTNRLILTELHVGAIMEQEFNAPIVTIECGGANDNSSHQVASNGLHKFFSQSNLFDSVSTAVDILRKPIRIELSDDASVGFSNHRLATTDITLRSDIESLNQDLTPQDEFIGWCAPNQALLFEAIDIDGSNKIDELFENRNGCLFTRKQMQLFMVTTVPEIATRDCLFYTTLSA